MSTSHYTPSSRRTRLIAAALAPILTFSIFAAVAVGLTGGAASSQWAAVVPASTAFVRQA
ncbi:MAG: hypothetical protein ACRET4_12780 [Steroidobacteraceae bacterium]